MFNFIKNLFSSSSSSPDLKSVISEGAFLVDVRNPDEFKSGLVNGAINVPLDQIGARLDQFKNKKNIIVFCRSGSRSKVAQNILKANGITNVFNGGSWHNVNQLVK